MLRISKCHIVANLPHLPLAVHTFDHLSQTVPKKFFYIAKRIRQHLSGSSFHLHSLASQTHQTVFILLISNYARSSSSSIFNKSKQSKVAKVISGSLGATDHIEASIFREEGSPQISIYHCNYIPWKPCAPVS